MWGVWGGGLRGLGREQAAEGGSKGGARVGAWLGAPGEHYEPGLSNSTSPGEGAAGVGARHGCSP